MAPLRGRLLRLLWVLVFVTFGTQALMGLLPGDPAAEMLGIFDRTPENIAIVRSELGLDQPLPVRYAKWVGKALQGDLGRSYRTGEDVGGALLERLPLSLELMVVSQTIALLIAIVVGVAAARRRGSRFDAAVSTASFAALSVPNFVLAILLIFAFSVNLHWFAATGYRPITGGVWAHVRTMLLPVVTMSLPATAVYIRVLRSEMISTLSRDFVLFARAKGMGRRHVLFRQALRPSSLPLVTLVGLNIGAAIGGTVIVETIFALPGMGRLVVDSIHARDYVLVQGAVVVFAVAYVIANFLADVTYTFLDPRIRHGR